MSDSVQAISFDEITQGRSARVTKIDGQDYMSSIDIVSLMTNMDNKRASNVLGELDEYDKEKLAKYTKMFQFTGRGQRPTPVIEKSKVHVLLSILKKRILRRFQLASTQMMPTIEYVYAMESEAFPGQLKLGRSSNVERRKSNLNTAVAPNPFEVLAVCPTFNAIRDEHAMHQHFADRRTAGEFFAVTEEEVVEFFNETLVPLYKHEKSMNSVEREPDDPDSKEEWKRVRQLQQYFRGAEGVEGHDQIPQESLKRATVEEQQVELNLWERRVRIRHMEAEIFKMQVETQDKNISNINKIKEVYISLCINGVIDEHARQKLKDSLLALIPPSVADL